MRVGVQQRCAAVREARRGGAIETVEHEFEVPEVLVGEVFADEVGERREVLREVSRAVMGGDRCGRPVDVTRASPPVRVDSGPTSVPLERSSRALV